MTARERMNLINTIAERAYAISQSHNLGYTKLEWLMDIDYADKDCPLKLDELASAPLLDFTHDAFGIRWHLNRQTKKLEGCFLPRYAA